MQFILFNTICGLVLGTNAPQDVVTLLEQYRQVVINKPIYMEGIPRSQLGALQQLEDLGPNILPIIRDSITKETHPRARAAMVSLFMRIGAFHPYRYVGPSATKPHPWAPKETDPASLPILSKDLAKRDDPADMESRVMAWWDQRDGFLKRNDLCTRLREITGFTVEDALHYDMQRAAMLHKEFSVYGIYSLPCYIEVIAEDNNPAIFMEFLATWRLFEEYRQPAVLRTTGFERVKAVQEAYPTREDKLAVVCTWWSKKKDTFTTLVDLYEAIDKVILKYCSHE